LENISYALNVCKILVWFGNIGRQTTVEIKKDQ